MGNGDGVNDRLDGGRWEEGEEEIGSWFPLSDLSCGPWQGSVLTQSIPDVMSPCSYLTLTTAMNCEEVGSIPREGGEGGWRMWDGDIRPSSCNNRIGGMGIG